MICCRYDIRLGEMLNFAVFCFLKSWLSSLFMGFKLKIVAGSSIRIEDWQEEEKLVWLTFNSLDSIPIYSSLCLPGMFFFRAYDIYIQFNNNINYTF